MRRLRPTTSRARTGPPSRRHGVRGFTLAEVLGVAVVSSILFLILTRWLLTLSGVAETTTAVNVAARAGGYTQERLASDMAALAPCGTYGPLLRLDGGAVDVFVRPETAGDALSDAFSAVVTDAAAAGSPATTADGVYLVTWRLDGSDVIRSSVPVAWPVEATTTGSAGSTGLAGGPDQAEVDACAAAAADAGLPPGERALPWRDRLLAQDYAGTTPVAFTAQHGDGPLARCGPGRTDAPEVPDGAASSAEPCTWHEHSSGPQAPSGPSVTAVHAVTATWSFRPPGAPAAVPVTRTFPVPGTVPGTGTADVL